MSRGGPTSGGEVPIVEVPPRDFKRLGTRLVLEVSTPSRGAQGVRVLVAHGDQPLGWFERADRGRDRAVFVSQRALDLPGETGALRAWLMGSDLVAALRERWPVGAPLRARVDAVGLGAQSVWIEAGSNHGVAVGDCWWRRVNGQPVARYDVRLVGSDVCFCRVVPLVTGLQAGPGEIVWLWPGPGQRRTGRAATAVSFVETGAEGQTVWVAAPRGVDAPAEPRLDFYRDGRYVGSGVVERRDARFWYARTLPAAGLGDVRVGDDAVVRTSADICRRRFATRVFALVPSGGLINGGEIDGLSAGDVGAVYRAGRQIGRVVLTKVQRGYSVAQWVDGNEQAAATRPAPSGEPGPDGTPAGLKRLDEVRLGRREEPTLALGVIERVVDGTLFSARLADATAAPLLAPLALRRAGRVIGVAVLLDATRGRALGFAVARSLSTPPAAGDELALSVELASGDWWATYAVAAALWSP